MNKKVVVIISLLFLSIAQLFGGDWVQVVDLSGKWKFSVGDDMKWAAPDFNDESWESINVSTNWEEQGFYGYDGYAWYRKEFSFTENVNGYDLFLSLGYIDDVDEVYLNGKLIGKTGSFPPNYNTAFESFRRYPISKDLLKKGSNTIAIRVYDYHLTGGIICGAVAIVRKKDQLVPQISLSPDWKFKVGDDTTWKLNNYNDSDWKTLIVPGIWENQGFRDYDGIAWYRKSVVIPEKYRGQQLILLLGRIDDSDETFFNGELIGKTGEFEPATELDDDFSLLRTYYLPTDKIKYNQPNIIAVRVYDRHKAGGIWDNPIGITTMDEYIKYWKNNRTK